jgi:hypothetical protein
MEFMGAQEQVFPPIVREAARSPDDLMHGMHARVDSGGCVPASTGAAS